MRSAVSPETPVSISSKMDRGEATAVSDEGLDSEHKAGDFPTRSDLATARARSPYRGEEEGDVIQPVEGGGVVRYPDG